MRIHTTGADCLVTVCVAATRPETLPDLVVTLKAQAFPNWELIVAAQGSNPTLHAYLEKEAKSDDRIRWIQLDHVGKSRAVNKAAEIARGEILAFTDDDCTADPTWLEVITTSFRQQPDVGVVAGDLIASKSVSGMVSTCPATRTIECLYRPSGHAPRAPAGFYFGGANLAVRHDVFDQLGGFDGFLGPGTDYPAAEDVDFGLRAELRHIPMWTRPESIIHHTNGRRYGILSVHRHIRNYALGSGALLAKLRMMDHVLVKDWSPKPTLEVVMSLPWAPMQSARHLWQSRYLRWSDADYSRRFQLSEDFLSQLREGNIAPELV